MNSLTKETKVTLLYILIAFSFSVLMRMIWVYQFQDYEAFKFTDQLMINTNDGYYWAEGARDILSGVSQENDLSPTTSAPSQLTAFFAFIIPFSFESIILYMPVFLSSLVVIPIILIARDLKNLEMGLIAALLASIAWSYYNRTMVGYYDTDMLNIVLPMFLLWAIIWAIDTNENKYLFIVAVDILVYRWWYPQSYALEFSFFGLILLYTLFFDRKNIYNYKLMAIMMLAMMNMDGFIRLVLVLGTFYIFREKKYDKYVYYIFGLSVFGLLFSGGFTPIWNRLEIYIFERETISSQEGLGLHFFAVMQTVREAGKIPFEVFANRISGNSITFVLSIIGYILLVFRHKVMLLAIPMIGLGFLASLGGLRFTVYAVPILAMGIAFLITESTRYITDKQSIKYLSYITLTLAILFPNYQHIDEYKVPTVMNNSEVNLLNKLKSKVQREDYMIAWWDYGYPIRYYADMKTLADGGKHSGSVNFPISYILTHPQNEAAKMARLDVEFTEKAFTQNKYNQTLKESDKKQLFTNVEEMTKEYGFDDTNDFLLSLQTEMELPKKTRNIYFYLPYKMLSIYPTVTMFSNMDLMTGEKYKMPTFFISKRFQERENDILLSQNISFNKADLSLIINGKRMTIKRFVTTKYINKQEFTKNVQYIDFSSGLSLIYMAAYNTFLLVDEKTYNSLYIQLFVLEEYDQVLFEQVKVNPHAKIYRLKI